MLLSKSEQKGPILGQEGAGGLKVHPWKRNDDYYRETDETGPISLSFDINLKRSTGSRTLW